PKRINGIVQSVPTVRGINAHLWTKWIACPRTARRELGISNRSRANNLLLSTKPAKPPGIFLAHLCDCALMKGVGLLIASNIIEEHSEFFFDLFAIATHSTLPLACWRKQDR